MQPLPYKSEIKIVSKEMCDHNLTDNSIEPVRNAVKSLNVMPSMRCLMTAGEALRRPWF